MQNTIKTLSLSTLASTLTAAMLVATPTITQAAEWQTISSSACVAYRPSHGASNDIFFNDSRVYVPAGKPARWVECSIPRTSIHDNVVKVYINHRNASAANTVNCTLIARGYNNAGSRSDNAKIASAGFKSSYAEVQAYGWGPVVAECLIHPGSSLYNINYK